MFYTVYFRQRACDGHPWHCLSPGESMSYLWEEPIKQKKLTIRVGLKMALSQEVTAVSKDQQTSLSKGSKGRKVKGLIGRKTKSILSMNFIDNEGNYHVKPL